MIGAFDRNIFGLANTIWSKMMADFRITDRSNDDFNQAAVIYLEKVARVKYLQDSILQILARWKKPYVLNLNEFRRCCDEIYSYAERKYTRGIMAMP